jgi:DNA excision repair protein ERCC-1
VEIGASASFSQAFASVEDTTHFQNELSNLNKQGDNSSAQQQQQQQQQRAFDRAADENAAEIVVVRSDRDHHALMQPHVLYVSTKQRGNGILKHIRNVPFAFSKMVPDYIMNTSRCALFLSCKYHSLYPQYIHRRIAELKTDFTLRILLVLVDVEDNANTLAFLNKLAVVHNMTLMLAWSEEEAARYLETYKAFDGKDASSIQRREQSLFADQVVDVLSSAKSVNKTDSAQLLSQFGSLKAVIAASMDELCLCPGMGEKKVRRLHDAFHKPFSSRQAKRRRETRPAADADYEEKVTQGVSEAKGAPCNTTSIESGTKELKEANEGESNASIV